MRKKDENKNKLVQAILEEYKPETAKRQLKMFRML